MRRSAVLFFLLSLVLYACTESARVIETPPNLDTTASGLIYYDSVEGTGRAATNGDLLQVHYKFWLVPDGAKDIYGDWSIDSSKNSLNMGDSYRNELPFSFYVGYGEAIAGFEEALLSMKVGGIRHAIIPPDLAYGKEEAGNVPPNSTLKYLIELLDVRTPARVYHIEDSSLIRTTSSGLRYVMVKEGEGPAPRTGQMVKFHLTGSLEDGTIFDSSVEREEPIEIPLGVAPVVAGLDEGIALMRPGGMIKLIVPPELGFGEESTQGLPPNSTLIFDIELLSVQDAPVDSGN